jgi:hypothetical protein
MNTGPDALRTAENKSERAKHQNETGTLRKVKNEYVRSKHENVTIRPRYRRKCVRECKTWKRDPTLSGPPKMRPGAQNMKIGPDALGTAENESDNAKKKTGPDALGTAGNDSVSAKHENETRHPRFRQKRVRACKT